MDCINLLVKLRNELPLYKWVVICCMYKMVSGELAYGTRAETELINLFIEVTDPL